MEAEEPAPEVVDAAPRGSHLYYSLRFLPEERRTAATAVYAVVQALERATAGVRDDAVAHAKLDWWRDELDRLYGGAPRHPATRALLPWLERYTLPAEYFQELLAGLEMDLDPGGFADFKELRLYCHQRSANAALLAVEVFGYRDPHTPRFAQAVGVAHCLSRTLRELRNHVRLGRIHLPQDELRRFQVNPGDLLLPQAGARVRALLAFQLERVQSHYRHAVSLLPDRDRASQHPFLVQIALEQALLEEIRRDGLRLLEHRVELPVLRRLWIAWRTARQAQRRAR